MSGEPWPQIEPGEPACYRIVVKGCLNEHWSGRLGGMRIACPQPDDQPQITVLSGQVQDQADLMGVLNTLHLLHMNILSVVCEPCHKVEGEP